VRYANNNRRYNAIIGTSDEDQKKSSGGMFTLCRRRHCTDEYFHEVYLILSRDDPGKISPGDGQRVMEHHFKMQGNIAGTGQAVPDLIYCAFLLKIPSNTIKTANTHPI
jgi:hypothetical protein